MRRQIFCFYVLVLFMLIMVKPVTSISASDLRPRVDVQRNLTSMHLAFTENLGQWDERALFRADAGRAMLWFTSDGVYYHFVRNIRGAVRDRIPGRLESDMPSDFEQLIVKAGLIGADPNPRIIGKEQMEYKCHYLIGDDPYTWHTDVPNYRSILYKDVYDGIDLEYYSNGHLLEYDFIVSPGADISLIAIEYEGILSLSIGEAGELLVETEWGVVKELAPLAYQNIDGNDRIIVCEYHLRSGNSFGFSPDEDYDRDLPLIIDPVLAFSTYLGGGGDEECYSIAADGSGAVFVTGYTNSNFDFPTRNPYHMYQGQKDAYVTKVSPAQKRLIYSTYLGGAGDDMGYSIAVDDSGYAYITGATASDDFPTVNPIMLDPDICGSDVFVTKLNRAGNAPVYSTYVGGSNHHDYGYGIAIDSSGCAYVAGYTNSSLFPTVNPYQAALNGQGDAIIIKLNTAGNDLVYSTYLGGDTLDFAWDIAVDDSGNAYITGETVSADFPTVNPFQTDQDKRDAFVTKLNAAGDDVVYSTYLGGWSDDRGQAIAVDGAGCAYVTGWTGAYNFPTQNPYQANQAYMDAYVTKFNPAGDGLVYSTYLGGGDSDFAFDIAVDDAGCAFVTGLTLSLNFPTKDPFQTDQDTTDAFLTKFNENGDGIVYSTYLGGNGYETGRGIAIDGICNLYVAGYTKSTDFPTVKPFQTDQGNTDAFVTRIVGGCYTATEETDNPTATAKVILHQNMPNPFNPVTTIRFNLPKSSEAKLVIYNVKGEQVRILVDGAAPAGRNEVRWDGKDEKGNNVSSGIYFYRLSTRGLTTSRKMVLLR